MTVEGQVPDRIGSGRAAEVFAHGAGRVIKVLREPGHEQSLAHEASAQQAARAAGVATAHVYGIEQYDGRSGIVMERLSGLDGLTAVDRAPWRVWSIGRSVGRLHREIAEVVAPPELPSLLEAVQRSVANSPRIPEAARARVLAVIATLPDGDRLCHMDFHPGNVIESPNGPVVIDFAAAMRGDSIADHARSLILFEAGEPADDTPRRERILIAAGRGLARRAYQRSYGAVDGKMLARWRPAVIAWRLDEGVPEERPRLLRMLSRALKELNA